MLVVVLSAVVVWRWITASPESAVSAVPPAPEEDRPIRQNGFERLFQPGRVPVFGEPAELTVREAGTLELPSGRLLAGDPTVLADAYDEPSPYVVTVPPGRYPVSVSLAEQLPVSADRGLPRVAAARMVVRPEPVVRWEHALQEGEEPGQLYGFGVDGGLDVGSVEALQRTQYQLDEGPPDGLAEVWDLRDEPSGRNVIAFRSGYGDGSYPTWIGWTAEGHPAVFVTDFGVVDPSF